MIDENLLTARDFIGIRAELVALLGNDMNRAGVLSRIYFRMHPQWKEAHQQAGHWWWRATYARVAEDTGLNEQQVRRVIKWLVDGGYIETREFRHNGITDRTLSYRVITSLSESTDGLSDSTDSMSESTPQSLSESTVLPSTKKKEEILASGFDLFWQAYPRKVNKVAAVKAWNTAMKKKVPAEEITLAAARYARTVKDTEEKFIAHPSSWLNQERWNDHPPVAPKPDPNAWMNRSVPPSYFEGKK